LRNHTHDRQLSEGAQHLVADLIAGMTTGVADRQPATRRSVEGR
jgi:hypothetical protein